jgi:Fic-DOC domain mobile mystery protein B
MVRKFQFPKDATPLDDVSGLKFPWVHTLRDLNRAEAENISQAQKKYLDKSIQDPALWFNPSYLKKIHQTMFGKVWDWAGQWRKSITNIGVKPVFIPMRVAELCVQVTSWSSISEWSYIERSARIHHQLVSIHPFENGNGRFSRLVADRYLVACNCTHPVWPSQIGIEGGVRERYILSLKAADRGDYQPIIELMREFHAREAF